LLVKRFAFDLELLAVATSLGYNRIRELPVRLDYRFSGSGVGSLAVLGALWDTAAIFYRLRLLRTYERKRRLFHAAGRAPAQLPLVSVVGEPAAVGLLDYDGLELAGAEEVHGELVARLNPGSRPSGNWVSAAIPYFHEPDVAAVVVPTVSASGGPLRQRVAAAVLESRLGSGSRRSRYFPGNVREVADFPAADVVMRAEDFRSATAQAVDEERLVAWLAARGRRTVYTPDASVSASPPPLVMPHLAATWTYGRARGAVARDSRGASLSAASALSLVPLAAALVGLGLVAAGGRWRDAGAALLLVYAAALALSGARAAARFRSLRVGFLEPAAVVATQVAYLSGFVRGLIAPGPGASRAHQRAAPPNRTA
jgi:hypothetical protein